MADTIRYYVNDATVRKESAVYDLVTITNPGGYNKHAVHPNIITQSMINASHTLEVMSATGTQMIQIVKLSHDNIKRLDFVAALDSLTFTSHDLFNYADDATLRSAWVTNLAARVQAYLDSSIKFEGSSSMRLTTTSALAAGYYVQKDIGTATGIDVTSYNALHFHFRKSTQNLVVRVYAVDIYGLSASSLVGVSDINAWEDKELLRSRFVDSQATATDWTKIRYLRFTVVSNTATNQSVWVDNMEFESLPATNNLLVSLYSCSSTAPTSASALSSWSLLTSDQGNSVFTFNVEKTKNSSNGQLFTIRDTFGLDFGHNNRLTVGNYIAIVCQAATDDVVMYGCTTATQPYADGKLFFSTNSGAVLLEQTGASMRFKLYSAISCKTKAIELSFDNPPKTSEFSVNYNDGITHIQSIISNGIYFNEELHTELLGLDYSNDNELVLYIQHDNNSTMTYVAIEFEIEYANTNS